MCFIVTNHECAAPLLAIVVLCAVVITPFVLLSFFQGSPIIDVIPCVGNGTLYALDYDEATSTLDYNLSVVLSFPSSGVNLRVKFAKLAAAPSYGGQKLGADVSLPSFELWRRMTGMVPLDVQGRQIVDGESQAVVASGYAADAARGYFTVEAKLHMQEGTDDRYMQYYTCTLLFPTADPRGAPNLFDGAVCILEELRKVRFYSRSRTEPASHLA